MTQNKKAFSDFSISLCIYLFFISFLCFSCTKKEETQQRALESEGGAQQAMEEVYFQETEEGKKRYEVWADSLDLFPGKKVLKNVRLKFYRDEDVLYLKGDEAEVINESGDIFITGHVSGKSEKGLEFNTDKLHWQAKEGRLSTESPVKLMSENIYIAGVGLDTTPKLKEASIKSDVYVSFFQSISDEIPMVITSETLLALFGDSPRATFEGNVTVKDARVEMHSDELIINFSPDGRRVEESIALGKVGIVAQDIEAECGKARLLNREKKIILEDNPIVWHERVKCRGTRIVYLLEERKVIVEDNVKGVFLPKSIDKILDDKIK